jgi:hypothetical protein
VIAEGATEREKSGTGGTITAALKASGSMRLLDNSPDEPCRVKVEDPGWAFAAALNVMVCATPGVNVRVDGEAVTPAGNPARAAETGPPNPLNPAAETLTCAVPPAASAVGWVGPDKAKSAWLVLVVAV